MMTSHQCASDTTTIATATTTSAAASAATIISLMSLFIVIGSYGVQGQQGYEQSAGGVFPGAPPIQYSSLSGPTFLNTSKSSIKAVAGTTAMLPCAVKNLHNYTVSWVRGRDIRLLTTSTITYTSDSRFVAAKLAGGSQWLLKIHYVRLTDAGVYLCQVSTSPHITLSINLTVQESIARVLPGPEVYVQVGSRLEVVCQVEGCPPPALLTWTRSGRPVATGAIESYHLDEDNVSTPVARLTLARALATPADTGNYSCSSTCTKIINVTVHVLRGEELAAMQHHNTSPHLLPNCLLLPCLLVWAVLLQCQWYKCIYVQSCRGHWTRQQSNSQFRGVIWSEAGLFSEGLATT